MMVRVLVATLLSLSTPFFAYAREGFLDLTMTEHIDMTLKMKEIGYPIFAGYGDVKSDTNRTEVADVVCRSYGYKSAGNYRNEWSINDRGQLAVITAEKGGGFIVNIHLPDAARSASRFTNLECLN